MTSIFLGKVINKRVKCLSNAVFLSDYDVFFPKITKFAEFWKKASLNETLHGK